MAARILSDHLCECGCGQRTYINAKGEPNRYVRSHGHRYHGATDGAEAGGSYAPTYVSWKAMRQRCRDKNHKNWSNYGGRGIAVCERWSGRNGFVNFLADMGERPGGTTTSGRALYSVERKDTNGNYEPNNCVWADNNAQSRNRRSTKLVHADVEAIRAAPSVAAAVTIATGLGVTEGYARRLRRGEKWPGVGVAA